MYVELRKPSTSVRVPDSGHDRGSRAQLGRTNPGFVSKTPKTGKQTGLGVFSVYFPVRFVSCERASPERSWTALHCARKHRMKGRRIVQLPLLSARQKLL